jgi:hypothetical protein
MLRPRFALLVAVVAVTAHDVTYLVGHGVAGYPAALGATGHDGHWVAVAIGVATLLLGAATVAAARWWWLRRQLAARAGSASRHRIGSVRPGALRLAARLFAAALVVFVVQENLEAVAIGASPPGIGILVAPGYLASMPALAVVALLFAVASELIDARILGLERALTAALGALPRASAAPIRRPSRADGSLRQSRRSLPNLGRAPPASVFA